MNSWLPDPGTEPLIGLDRTRSPVRFAPRVRELIHSDMFRYTGLRDWSWRMYHAVWLYSPGFRWSFWFRITQGLRMGGRDKRRGWRRLAFWAASHVMHYYSYKFGFDVPVSVEIGPGLKLGHFGGVVINAAAKLGSNCTISHGATVGTVSRGKKQGTPVIGDRVWLGPGCCVVGRIHVGDDSLIGANAVVFTNVPRDAIVVGNPGRVVSTDPDKGSRGYVFRRWEVT